MPNSTLEQILKHLCTLEASLVAVLHRCSSLYKTCICVSFISMIHQLCPPQLVDSPLLPTTSKIQTPRNYAPGLLVLGVACSKSGTTMLQTHRHRGVLITFSRTSRVRRISSVLETKKNLTVGRRLNDGDRLSVWLITTADANVVCGSNDYTKLTTEWNKREERLSYTFEAPVNGASIQ